MPSLTIDLSNAGGSIRDFPVGVYEAEVIKADLEVSKGTGNPMITLELEIHHPTMGSTTLRDWLPVSFPSKVKSFWVAAMNYTAQQAAEALSRGSEVELDPAELVGVQILVQIGEKESTNDGKMYKGVVPPFYYPVSRNDLVNWDNLERPF
jgi:hypothetical protein